MKRGKAGRYDGSCSSCKVMFVRGERVVFKDAVHEGCFRGQFAAIPPAPTLEYTRLKALDALEEAVQAAAQVNGVSDELEKEWTRYEKLKSSGMRPGSLQEEKTAMRIAILSIVKLAFPI